MLTQDWQSFVDQHTISHAAWITGKCKCCHNTIGITSIHMESMTIKIFDNRRISPPENTITVYFEEQENGKIIGKFTVDAPPINQE